MVVALAEMTTVRVALDDGVPYQVTEVDILCLALSNRWWLCALRRYVRPLE